MKYRFTLPARVGVENESLPLALAHLRQQNVYEVTFEAETPAEVDCGDDGQAARVFVDRALAVARYVVKALEAKS